MIITDQKTIAKELKSSIEDAVFWADYSDYNADCFLSEGYPVEAARAREQANIHRQTATDLRIMLLADSCVKIEQRVVPIEEQPEDPPSWM